MINLGYNVSFFENVKDNRAKATLWTWRGICGYIEDPEIRVQKDGWAFCPSVFSATDDKPVTRRNDSAVEVSLAVLDFDENLDFDLLKERLDLTKFQYALHSTHSHQRKTDKNPNGEPRFRAIIPLCSPIPASEYPKLWDWVVRQLDVPADRSKRAVASIFFLPAKAEEMSPYNKHIGEGELLDWHSIEFNDSEDDGLNSLNSLNSLEKFEFHEDRDEELHRRIHNRGRINFQDKVDAKCLAHNGKGNTALMYDPATGKVYCNAGCSYFDILKAEGLPDGRLPSRKSAEKLKEFSTGQNKEPVPDEKCFYGLAGEFVRIFEPVSEGDEMGLLIQFLTAFGSITGRNAYFRIENDRHYTNLFTVLVGNTASGRKGTSWGRVKQVFEGLDEHFDNDGIVTGLASGEGLINCVRDPIEKKSGKSGGKIETTIEDVGIDDKRKIVFEGEFSQVLRVQGRDGNTLSSVIRNLWDTGNAQNLAKNSPLRTTNAHVSIIGHITSQELRACLDQVESVNGYANRFLWVCVERSKFLPFGADTPIEVNDLREKLRECIDFARDVERMNFSQEARSLWAKAYIGLETSRYGTLAKITQRASPYVLRIACIFALLDKRHNIHTEHLEAALAVWQYCEDSARSIFGDSTGDKLADGILQHLRDAEDGLSRTDINNLTGKNQTSKRINDALQLLADNNLADYRKEVKEGSKKPVELWFANGLNEFNEFVPDERVESYSTHEEYTQPGIEYGDPAIADYSHQEGYSIH